MRTWVGTLLMVGVVAAGCGSGAVSARAPAVSQPAQSRATPRLWPQEVAFWNSREGVMVGYWSKQHCGVRECRPVIETTADGGRDWTVSAHIHSRLTAVTLVPGGSLVATVSGGGLLISADRARTWRWLTHERVYNPSFGSATQGWALAPGRRSADLARVVVTANGGRTWRLLPDPCQGAAIAQYESVSAVSPAVAYVVCGSEPGAGQQSKMIVRTDDGGTTWTIVDAMLMPGDPTPAPAPSRGLPSSGYVSGITILPNLQGWLWLGRGLLYHTGNGARWRPIATRVVHPDATTVVSADFMSSTAGYMLLWESGGTHLLRTADGGARWSAVHTWPG